MGKDLRGRECGNGIRQRKDGLYSVRLNKGKGKRSEKYFTSLLEAKNWQADQEYERRHKRKATLSEMDVDTWFEFWIGNIVSDLAPNTIRNYRNRYETNVQPFIGNMIMSEVKPMHCKAILNSMDETYAGSTIRQTYIAMGTMFRSAVMNDIIVKHPMDGVRYTKPIRAVDDIHFLTVEEQKQFLEQARKTHNYRQYALILQTGLRTGEMIGLTWDDIDWEKRTISVKKTLEYRHSTSIWRAGPPKTKASYRIIPLTNEAYQLLTEVYNERFSRKESESLALELPYMDRRTGTLDKLVMKNLVFVNYRTGEPIKNSSYDSHLYKICDEAGIERFCMHALRHTFATRAIESGMQPKVLQQILGHASIKTTMDRYVHVTNETLIAGMGQFENNMAACL